MFIGIQAEDVHTEGDGQCVYTILHASVCKTVKKTLPASRPVIKTVVCFQDTTLSLN